MVVCSRHFHEGELVFNPKHILASAVLLTFNKPAVHRRCCCAGKPAYEMYDRHPDWVPSLHLGHDEGNEPHTERERFARTTPAPPADVDDQSSDGATRPVVAEWRSQVAPDPRSASRARVGRSL